MMTMELNTILVGLDMTKTDDTVLRYTSWLAQLIKPKKLYILHIYPDLESIETSEEIAADEWVERAMRQKTRQYFENYTDYDLEFIVDDGKAYDRILHWVKVKKPDLFLLGKKPEQKNKPGKLPSKIVTETPCSLLFVTERPSYDLKNIIVSSDFSAISENAMQLAIDLANDHATKTCIHCQYVYDLPTGYSTLGKSEAEYEKTMYYHANEKYEDFIQKLDQKGQRIVPILTYADEENAVELIHENADNVQADLIVAAGRGRTFLANLLLKSFTKELFEKDQHIPLLILKSDQQMSFSEAISKL